MTADRAESRGAEEIICHFFSFTRGDIENDYIKNGRSTVMEKITAELERGGCRCHEKNPRGT